MQRASVPIQLEEAARSPSLLRRAILLLAWPVAAEMSLHTITQVVDMAMVGRLGPAAVAAVGLSFRPLFFVMSIFLGIGGGTTALVARFTGAGDRDLANRTLHQALLFSAPLAFVLAGFLGIFSRSVVAFMGAAPEVLPLGASYVRLMSPGIMLSHLGMVATSGLRGAGDTRTTMRVSAAVNVLNVTLNYILIFGHLGFPALGVTGAGIATSTARGIGGLVILVLLCRGRLVLRLPWPNLGRWDRDLVVRILRVGLPAMMERVLNSSAMILQLKMLATQGTTVVAAATLAQNVEELSFLPAIGLSVAASALVGQMLGRRDPDTAERAGWQSAYLGVAFMGSMGLIFLTVPHFLLTIYGAEGELLSMGVMLLRIVGLFQIPMALSNILAGGAQGRGRHHIGHVHNLILHLGGPPGTDGPGPIRARPGPRGRLRRPLRRLVHPGSDSERALPAGRVEGEGGVAEDLGRHHGRAHSASGGRRPAERVSLLGSAAPSLVCFVLMSA